MDMFKGSTIHTDSKCDINTLVFNLVYCSDPPYLNITLSWSCSTVFKKIGFSDIALIDTVFMLNYALQQFVDLVG